MAFTVDFHIHTKYSYDALNKPESIIVKAKKCGLDAVVVLDHDTVKGGVKTASLDSHGVMVIPAVEVKTDIGDIIGLFMRKEIESTEYRAVIKEIRTQDGLVMLPHPYYKHKLTDDLYDKIDLIEINNARLLSEMNRKAEKLAEKHNIAAVSGSDAHFPWEIGRCVTVFEETPLTRDEFIDLILHGKRTHKAGNSGIVNTVLSQLIKYIRRPKAILERLRIG